MLLPRSPYGEDSPRRRSPITPKPCASSTYSSAPWRRATSAKAARSGGLPVIEFTPSMHTSRVGSGSRSSPGQGTRAGGIGLAAHQLVEVVGVLEAEPAHRRAARLGDLAAV